MADDSEEYGTVAYFQKYEPEASEVMFRAGFEAGRLAERADVVAAARDCARLAIADGGGELADTLQAFAIQVDCGRHIGAAGRERGGG